MLNAYNKGIVIGFYIAVNQIEIMIINRNSDAGNYNNNSLFARFTNQVVYKPFYFVLIY